MKSRFNFNTKLIVSVLGVVAVAVAAVGFALYNQSSSAMTRLGRAAIENSVHELAGAFELQNEQLQSRLRSEVEFLEGRINASGRLFLNKMDPKTVRITDQNSGQSQSVTIPVLETNGRPVGEALEMVDGFKERFGSDATIFQILDGKLLRVATTVTTPSGERAVGTYIPASSPVYAAITAGETYVGLANVAGTRMITTYAPYKDTFGRPIAVLFVGMPVLSPAFERYVGESDFAGHGYAFVYDAEGKLLIHPSIAGKNLSELGLWEGVFKDAEGFVTYEYQGQPKIANVSRFPEWGWTVGMTMSRSEMLLGSQERMLAVTLLVGAGALVLAALVVLFGIKRLMAPLRRLGDTTRKIAEGDLSAHCDYAADDDIGRTVASVNAMVAELKNKLGFSQGLLDNLTMPCMVVDPQAEITFVNRPLLDLLGKRGDPEDHLGTNASVFFYGERHREAITAKAIREKRAIVGVEREVPASGGSVFARIDAAPLYDLDDNLIGSFALLTDLTEIRRQQQRIEAQNERIAKAAAEADGVSDRVATASRELSGRVQDSSRGATEQQRMTQEAATAMEEMNASVMEVARNASGAAELAENTRERAEQGAQLVGQVVEVIADIQSKADQLTTDMDELGEQARGISDIMGVINDIADQTNLLALNAAIEAARAGDAGRGFAVVADEVRKLAEKTMAATDEVASYIRSIQDSAKRNLESTRAAAEAVTRSTELAGRSGRSLDEIVKLAQDNADQVRSIATASEQQSAASEQIGKTSADINQIAEETVEAMARSAGAVDELSELSGRLRSIIVEMQQ